MCKNSFCPDKFTYYKGLQKNLLQNFNKCFSKILTFENGDIIMVTVRLESCPILDISNGVFRERISAKILKRKDGA